MFRCVGVCVGVLVCLVCLSLNLVYLVLGVGVLVLVLGDDVLGVLVCWCAGVGVDVLMSDVLVCWCVYVYVIYTRVLSFDLFYGNI